MGDDFSIEIDIGFSLGGDVGEIHGDAMEKGKERCKGNSTMTLSRELSRLKAGKLSAQGNLGRSVFGGRQYRFP
jgi:hypothetical protein